MKGGKMATKSIDGPLRIGIVGSRRRDAAMDLVLTRRAFDNIASLNDNIVSGGCPKGGDRFAEVIAKQDGREITICYPNWAKFGKAAGFIRNGRIAELSDVLIACVTEERTGGTEDTIKKFLKLYNLTEQAAIENGLLILS
jgi:hypothetical protein